MKQYFCAAVVCTVLTTVPGCDVVPMTFPTGFRLGTASASYQVEGAWNVSGKSESNWDYYTHNYPERITDRSNGDVACNSYYKYKEDVQLIKSIGFDFYRFSVSWPRILPTGFTNIINEEGLQYYKNLTAELVANGIEPIVTIYHFDHPKLLEEMGGWTNELMSNLPVILVEQESEVCRSLGRTILGIAGYWCGHNVLKAHAKTYRMYDEEFREIQQGLLSIVIPIQAHIPRSSTDLEAAETIFQFTCGWYTHPIYESDYPEIMKTRIAMISEHQDYPRSRLPTFSAEWIDIIRGTHDYFGFNHYTSNIVYADPDAELGIYNDDDGVILDRDPSWVVTASPWFYVNPPGISFALRQIRDHYDNPPVWIMENGYSDQGQLEDHNRASYYYEHLRELLIALKRDGCNVEGYSTWSILDNFEWSAGYTERFGIVGMDFDDPERPRALKTSTRWLTRVVSRRKLQPVPTNTNARKRSLWLK